MSLINKIREKRDSWLVRFEEQRQREVDSEYRVIDREKENEEIKKNRAKVGVFPKKDNEFFSPPTGREISFPE